MAAKTGTYSLINSTTLGSSQSSVTFSSIPATFTDLVLVVSGKSAGSYFNSRITFNNDTSNNYSYTTVGVNFPGNTATLVSGQVSNNANIRGAQFDNADNQFFIVNLFSYSETNVKKTALVKTYNSDGGSYGDSPTYLVGLWNSTSAITTITLSTDGASYATGSTFKLYGVEAGNL